MTDITELAQRARINAECGEYLSPAETLELVEELEKAQQHIARQEQILLNQDESLSIRRGELEKAQQSPIMPLGLHPDTQTLVTYFCTALAEKLYKAQLKYGYDTDWKQDGWPSQCQAHFHQHIAKGDPRDVAAYCAFMWWHGWSTKPAEVLEARTVKLPQRLQPGADGYDDWYVHSDDDGEYLKVDDVLAMLTAAGIKVEAE